MTWGQRVRAARGPLTQEEIAARCDCTQPVISRIEAGLQLPSDDMKVRLARALGIQIAELFPWDEIEPVAS